MSEIKRLNYFQSQFLRAKDFQDEQKYHLGMRRIHNQRLHSWGVVDGLDFKIEGNAIRVSPGFAIDKDGREILLQNETVVPVPNRPFRYVYVTAEYKDPEDLADKYSSNGNEFTRVTEKPDIKVVFTETEDVPKVGTAVVLGRIAQGGQDLDRSVCQYAGAVLNPNAGITASKLTVSHHARWGERGYDFEGMGHTIGVQRDAAYARFSRHFAWYLGGLYTENGLDPGTGGTRVMSLAGTEKTVEVKDGDQTRMVKIGPGLTVEVDATFKKGLTVENNATFKRGLSQEGWKDIPANLFKPGWRNWDKSQSSGYASAGCFKDSLGIVHLRGLVTNDDPDKIVVCFMPDGYEPEFRSAHVVPICSSQGNPTVEVHNFGRLDVETKAGALILRSGKREPGTTDWYLSLDGVSFTAKTPVGS
jgi:hypothetical protein